MRELSLFPEPFVRGTDESPSQQNPKPRSCLMSQLDQTQLAQIVGAVLAALRTEGQSTAPKAATVASPTDKLSQRDAAIRAGFARRGIKNVTLMNRADGFQ
jgi:hypothetical protein